jgi:hypothetical protein
MFSFLIFPKHIFSTYEQLKYTVKGEINATIYDAT